MVIFRTLNYYIWIFFGLIGAALYYGATIGKNNESKRKAKALSRMREIHETADNVRRASKYTVIPATQRLRDNDALRDG